VKRSGIADLPLHGGLGASPAVAGGESRDVRRRRGISGTLTRPIAQLARQIPAAWRPICVEISQLLQL